MTKRNKQKLDYEQEAKQKAATLLALGLKPKVATKTGQTGPSRPQPGDRVGAYLSYDQHHMELLGYGVYQGRHEPSIKGLATESWVHHKIVLDDGRVVWGFMCYWGPEAKVRAMEASRTVTRNDIDLIESMQRELESRDSSAAGSTSVE